MKHCMQLIGDSSECVVEQGDVIDSLGQLSTQFLLNSKVSRPRSLQLCLQLIPLKPVETHMHKLSISH